MAKKIGIVERAKAAASHEELRQLEAEVKNFDFISVQTLSRFHRAVVKRGKELSDASNS
jgi:hypothetical protein